MAKKSMVVKNIRRRRISDRYRERRLELKKVLKSTKTSNDEKRLARISLEKLPRDSILIGYEIGVLLLEGLVLIIESLVCQELHLEKWL